MLLAEALARRAEAQDRLNKLQERLVQGAMIQEGDTPVEDPAAMLEEAAALLQEIETLVRRINHTNAQTAFEGATLTDAIARRDALLRSRRLRHHDRLPLFPLRGPLRPRRGRESPARHGRQRREGLPRAGYKDPAAQLDN